MRRATFRTCHAPPCRHIDLHIRDARELQSLQLHLFGDHLASENFFHRLEELRVQGASQLPSLEVYHYCLLLGFEGKYRLEGPEK